MGEWADLKRDWARLAKALPDINEFAGFCSGLRCICSLMGGGKCIPCRSREFCDATRARYELAKERAPIAPVAPGEVKP